MENRKLYLSSGQFTKTSAFLLPSTGVSIPLLRNYGFKNAYIGDKGYAKAAEFPPAVFVLHEVPEKKYGVTFNEDFEKFCNEIRSYPNFIDEYDPADGLVMFILEILDEWKHILPLFIKGQYSKFDRAYVKKYFKKRVYVGKDMYGLNLWKPSKNWMILTADDNIKQEIEKDLDVTLPEGTEVFSKPNLEEEIYNTK